MSIIFIATVNTEMRFETTCSSVTESTLTSVGNKAIHNYVDKAK